MDPQKKDNQAQHWASIFASLAAIISATTGAFVAYYNLKRPAPSPIIRIEGSSTPISRPIFTPLVKSTQPVAFPTPELSPAIIKPTQLLPSPSVTPIIQPSQIPPTPSISPSPSNQIFNTPSPDIPNSSSPSN